MVTPLKNKTKLKIPITPDIAKKTVAKQLEPYQFKPGVSGNPNGRPKGSISLVTLLKQTLEEMSPDGRRNAAKVLVENIVQDALDNNNDMRKLIFNYLEGMPSQKLEQTGGTMNLNIEVTSEQFERLIRERAKQLDSGESI